MSRNEGTGFESYRLVLVAALFLKMIYEVKDEDRWELTDTTYAVCLAPVK